MKLSPAQAQQFSGWLPESSLLTTAEPGGLLYASASMRDQLVLVESGQIRLIDPGGTFGSQTLCKQDSPVLLGLSCLVDGAYQEEARAASLCQVRSVELSLLAPEAVSWMRQILQAQIDPAEWPSIQLALHQALGEASLRFASGSELATAITLLPAESLAAASSQPDDAALLFLDQDRDGFHYGQLITAGVARSFFAAQPWPRLASCPFRDFPAAEEPGPAPEQPAPIPITLELLPEQEAATDQAQGFRLIRGRNRFDAFTACITMLVVHFQLPTRRDTIRRAAALLDHDNIRWGVRLLSILDDLGLAVRSVRIRPDRPLRLPFPCLWIDSNGACSLLVKATARHLVILNPLQGMERLSEREAYERFTAVPEVIAVDIGLHTPRKRFGLFWLMPYVKRYRLQLVEVFAASFLNQLFALATPLLFQQIIDRVISKGAADALAPLVVLMLLFVALETIFGSLRTFQFVEVSNRIDVGVGSAIVSRLLRINARFFDKRPVGELSSRLSELDNIRRFLTGTALTVVLDAAFSLLYFAVMLFYSPLLTLVIVLTLPPLLLVTVGISPLTQRLIRRRAEAASRTQSLLVEILGGIQTVKLQNAELTARRQWEDRHLDSINQGFKAILANTTSSNALQLISKVSSILVIGIGAWLVLRNELTLGELIAFRIISGYVTQPMLRLASTWQSFQEMSLSLERVGDVVNQPLEVGENEEGNIEIPGLRGGICFDAVGFSYSSAAPPVLSSVSLDIKPGDFVGFVGQSGCGKSSLLKMIPRLYRPSSGRLLVDGYDISKVDLYSLRSQIGFVPQDCMLFEGTVFSNIALSDPQVESDRVVAMARLACAHEFIMGLPYGYSTPVGEKGAGLSGGQRQRIALARMLLENPSLVILDEATSALDVDTERQVVENLRKHFADQTLLMITHRLSTLVDADRIVVLHAGRVDSVGSHADLMAQRGRYYALYQSQFGEQA